MIPAPNPEPLPDDSWTPPAWPMFGLAGDVEPFVAAAARAGRLPVALATIVALDGGGPRPPGTRMAIDAAGGVCGYLSGGCIEADVVRHARAVLRDGAPRLLRYGEGSPWFDLPLPCGGGMSVLVERLADDDPALAAWLGRGRQPLLWRSDGSRRTARPPVADAPLVTRCTWDGEHYEMQMPPPWRLVVSGHDPAALAIALLGAQAGFETHLLRAAAMPPPAHDVRVHGGDMGGSLAALAPDRWTAVAVAGHDETADRAMLAVALPSPASYVGLLGARRRLAAHRRALLGSGLPPHQMERLRAPIGMALGGKAPWEVAISVIAEIVAHRQAVDEKNVLS